MRLLVVVPKWDELTALAWGLDVQLDHAPEVARSGSRLFHFQRDQHAGENVDVVAAFMDSQNNTNSAVAITEAVLRFNPDAAILVGTALGNANKVTIGSVIVAKSVADIVERASSPTDANWQLTTVPGSPLLLDLARSAIGSIGHRHMSDWTYQLADSLGIMHDQQVEQFLAAGTPTVSDEVIASGNDYLMDIDDPGRQVWQTATKAHAYDMESAGFARACESLAVPWLVVRGISDFGTVSSRLRPRIGRSRAFKRPWSASIRLFAYCPVL